MPSRASWIRLAVFFLLPFAGVGAFLLWRWNEHRPPGHELCEQQAEHRLDLMYGIRLAEVANGDPKDYDHLRTNMIQTCERYWTRGYAECLRKAPNLSVVEECEHVGRVR